jgi:hypothetical protein
MKMGCNTARPPAGIVLLALLGSLAGCGRHEAFQATRTVAGIRISAVATHNHPFLAEYRRAFAVGTGARIAFGNDPGGHPYINVFETERTLVLQSFHPDLAVIDKATLIVTMDTRPLLPAEQAGFVGKFTFVRTPRGRSYVFLPKEEEATFDPTVVHGD